MKSNFDFLQSNWDFLYEYAIEAEKSAKAAPITSAIYSRIVLEKAVLWLFENEGYLSQPYQVSLISLMSESTFKDLIPLSILPELHHIRKIGNQAAHGKKVPKEQSIASVKFIFRFVAWFYKSYTISQIQIPDFDDSLLPNVSNETPKAQLDSLMQAVEETSQTALKEHKRLLEIEEENEVLKKRLQEVEKTRKRNEPVTIPPSLFTEEQTRELLIDANLREAGWNPSLTNVREFEVVGMPKTVNKTGIGYADYVLWGDNGLPLAVIEAKKASKEAELGKHQAELYANCLEQMTGQRPIIFYSNGYDNYIWDDTFYPTRKIFGFYTKDELELLINRRQSRKDLRTFSIDENISDRYYQKLAIKRIAEKFIADYKNEFRGASRAALLVMATGTGKTRTAISLVDLLYRAGWIKRVLFLADRNALVTQAKRNFEKLLPNLSSIDLTKEPEDKNTRLVFSTYPTIMNKIDSLKSKEERFYGVGHFDLIIVDEAHRSVYQKYRNIFEYFDALRIGLTATPKDDADHDTYELFDEEFQVPTYNYELKDAVNDKYLNPYRSRIVDLNFIKRGIKYDELDEVDKIKYEETFRDESGFMPTEIDSSAINTWLYNSDTIDKVLHYLMKEGLKVEDGDKIGKTIIFAKNHTHAVLIVERFNKQFALFGSKFIRVIDNYEKYAQDLIDDFSLAKKEPQIAVSVDMMDTGIDIPEIVNLVLFKPVYSKAKFWQMIGRGTRLCPNLHAIGKDKEEFIVFDFCGNFDFFNENQEGREAGSVESISSRLFKLAIYISLYIAENLMEEEGYAHEREELLHWCHHRVKDLNKENFAVKMVLRDVEKYQQKDAWYALTYADLKSVFEKIAPLVFVPDKDEAAKRFDLLMQNFKLSNLESTPKQSYYHREVIHIAKILTKLGNINEVRQQMTLILALQQNEYWSETNIFKLENIRKKLRDLVKYLPKQELVKYKINIKDAIINDREGEYILSGFTKSESYKAKFESYIDNHKSNIIISKIFKNIKLTSAELEALDALIFDNSDLNDRKAFHQTYGDKPLAQLIRTIIGMDEHAVNDAFSDFIDGFELNSIQYHFIQTIVKHFSKKGIIELKELALPPYTDINDLGIFGIFNDDNQDKVLQIVNGLNRVEVG
ncbi:MAG: DEAD/DEAH box helicase family protein [Bacteroidales bacterium]|nr:DEAD/DEAH box helicase family protein [Bacteroidales bacterium]